MGDLTAPPRDPRDLVHPEQGHVVPHPRTLTPRKTLFQKYPASPLSAEKGQIDLGRYLRGVPPSQRARAPLGTNPQVSIFGGGAV